MAAREQQRSVRADHGLLAILRELHHKADAPPTSTEVAEAAGVPVEYSEFIEQRLEQNERRGFVQRDAHGHWLLTAAGTAAATPTP